MKAGLKLIEPDEALKDSYDGLVQEFVARGEKLIPFVLAFPYHDFPAFLQQLRDAASGRSLPPGFVAHSTYWLVAGGRVLGVSNLRHKLTPSLKREGGHIGYSIRPSERGRGYSVELLAGMLQIAKAHGLDRVLITCAKDNLRSSRTIRRNNGVLDSEEFIPERSEWVERYWIECK